MARRPGYGVRDERARVVAEEEVGRPRWSLRRSPHSRVVGNDDHVRFPLALVQEGAARSRRDRLDAVFAARTRRCEPCKQNDEHRSRPHHGRMIFA
jgi:hypothetical protein